MWEYGCCLGWVSMGVIGCVNEYGCESKGKSE